jgi:hypothetical protein
VPAYLAAQAPLLKKRALARLRLGAVPLRANTDHDTLYSARICDCSSGQGVDNEEHLLLCCERLAHVRQRHTAVWHGRQSIDALMESVYDKDQVGTLMDYVADVIQCFEGHRQGSVPDIAG